MRIRGFCGSNLSTYIHGGNSEEIHLYYVRLGVCTRRVGLVNANISIQSATSRLGKFQFVTDPPKPKSSGFVTKCDGFNSVG